MTFRIDRFDSKTFSKLFITITVWGVTLMYWLLHNATALYSIGPDLSNDSFPDWILSSPHPKMVPSLLVKSQLSERHLVDSKKDL